MAPKTAQSGNDIRSFFRGSPASQPKQAATSTVTGSSSNQPIELDLSDEDQPTTSTSARGRPPRSPKKAKIPESGPSASAGVSTSKSSTVKSVPLSARESPSKIGVASSSKRRNYTIESAEDDSELPARPVKKALSSRERNTSYGRSAKAREDDEFELQDLTPEEEDAEGHILDLDEEKKPKKGRKPSARGKPPARANPTVPAGKVESDVSTVSKGGRSPEKISTTVGKPKPKFNWAAKAAARAVGPANPGSKEIPEGQPNCLAGLTFVFTGELSSLAREEAIDLANRYGGRVTGQPSRKTSYVVVGTDAGPSKLATIKKLEIKTLDEDGFLELIRSREGVLDEKTQKKMEEEEQKIIKVAKEMERREQVTQKESREKATSVGKPLQGSSELWTTRYAPQTLNEICGNKTAVEKLQRWLVDWPKNFREGFKKPGKDGMGVYRAVLISGPPGIGKTTSAHLVAKLAGYTPIEVNASDARSKKLVMNSTNVSNQSLDGWMHGSGEHTTVAGIDLSGRSVLIMDEVDGMSGSDRGGIAALNQLIKKTRVPIICIANDRTLQKMKPLQGTTYNLPFRKPDAKTIRSRIMSILFKEKMKIPPPVVDQLVNGVQCDIRQVLNMLSTWKLSQHNMDFDHAKQLAAMNEKYTTMTPWGILEKLFGPYAFSATSRESLNDKIEYYFHDYSFVPLFIQENYLKTNPALARNEEGFMKELKHLELLDLSARSISDADLVDAMIHGPEQHWSLMPLHAVTSTVYPASQVYGSSGHFGTWQAYSFPAWLGQNSKHQALRRQLGDVQARMRSKVSGDKSEIRMTYIPMMTSRLVKPLIDHGTNAIDDVIRTMDEYFVSKDEWDTIVELGVGDNRGDDVLKKIAPATKTNFTRKYNNVDHPIPFARGQDIGASLMKSKEEKPDVEEAVELDEEPEEEEEDAANTGRRKPKDPTGIADDKLLRVAKGKTAGRVPRKK